LLATTKQPPRDLVSTISQLPVPCITFFRNQIGNEARCIYVRFLGVRPSRPHSTCLSPHCGAWTGAPLKTLSNAEWKEFKMHDAFFLGMQCLARKSAKCPWVEGSLQGVSEAFKLRSHHFHVPISVLSQVLASFPLCPTCVITQLRTSAQAAVYPCCEYNYTLLQNQCD